MNVKMKMKRYSHKGNVWLSIKLNSSGHTRIKLKKLNLEKLRLVKLFCKSKKKKDFELLRKIKIKNEDLCS